MEHSRTLHSDQTPANDERTEEQLQSDIDKALTVWISLSGKITDRDPHSENYRRENRVGYTSGLDLRGFDFSEETWDESTLSTCNFTDCDLSGSTGSLPEFQWVLVGGANLTGVTWMDDIRHLVYDDGTIWPHGQAPFGIKLPQFENREARAIMISSSEARWKMYMARKRRVLIAGCAVALAGFATLIYVLTR